MSKLGKGINLQINQELHFAFSLFLQKDIENPSTKPMINYLSITELEGKSNSDLNHIMFNIQHKDSFYLPKLKENAKLEDAMFYYNSLLDYKQLSAYYPLKCVEIDKLEEEKNRSVDLIRVKLNAILNPNI